MAKMTMHKELDMLREEVEELRRQKEIKEKEESIKAIEKRESKDEENAEIEQKAEEIMESIREGKTDAKEALELIRKNNYDAILMDIGLGLGKNGIELTKEIKLIPEYENTPIIAVTAYASRRDEEYILNHGLDFYIAKPFYKKDILKILEKALNIELSDLSKQD